MMSMMPVILTFPSERGVFLKEESSKLYTTFNYFIGRTLTEVPLSFFFPVLNSVICFWMIGYRDDDSDAIYKYFLVMILQGFVGNSLGLLTGSVFTDPKVAISMMPLLYLPF
jgi:hypothetical protein